MTARGTVRPGVRRAYGYTWACPACGQEMPAPPVGASFDTASMEERRSAAEADWQEHSEICSEQPDKLVSILRGLP